MKTAILAALCILAIPAASQAQGASTDDLIRALKPQAGGMTRGIRPVEPSGLAPSGAPAYPTPSTQARDRPTVGSALNRRSPPPAAEGLASVNIRVQFDNGSDRLTPSAMQSLDNLGRALANPELSGYRFRIEGHTDAVGSREMNEALSARRATAVTEYIVSHFGVDRARLSPVGMGESQMLVPTAQGVPEPRNRRVQVVNLGA